jgi:hypothetical protein
LISPTHPHQIGVVTHMEPKTISTTLIAAASIIGLDRSIDILQNERAGVLSAVDHFHKMTVGDLADALKSEVRPVATKRRRTPVVRPVATNRIGRLSDNRGAVKDLEPCLGVNPVTMHLSLKEVLSKKKETPIRFIMEALQTKGLLTDSAAARVAVEKFIAKDKTFSCATRGVYRLRAKPV